ncbi:hypothetical protein HDU93_005258 [Gonapodya sp. JEL0774]|nr:hypothetical protein HDU93_005258 [Gonapodya sp. JEL0774]
MVKSPMHTDSAGSDNPGYLVWLLRVIPEALRRSTPSGRSSRQKAPRKGGPLGRTPSERALMEYIRRRPEPEIVVAAGAFGNSAGASSASVGGSGSLRESSSSSPVQEMSQIRYPEPALAYPGSVAASSGQHAVPPQFQIQSFSMSNQGSPNQRQSFHQKHPSRSSHTLPNSRRHSHPYSRATSPHSLASPTSTLSDPSRAPGSPTTGAQTGATSAVTSGETATGNSPTGSRDRSRSPDAVSETDVALVRAGRHGHMVKVVAEAGGGGSVVVGTERSMERVKSGKGEVGTAPGSARVPKRGKSNRSGKEESSYQTSERLEAWRRSYVAELSISATPAAPLMPGQNLAGHTSGGTIASAIVNSPPDSGAVGSTAGSTTESSVLSDVWRLTYEDFSKFVPSGSEREDPPGDEAEQRSGRKKSGGSAKRKKSGDRKNGDVTTPSGRKSSRTRSSGGEKDKDKRISTAKTDRWEDGVVEMRPTSVGGVSLAAPTPTKDLQRPTSAAGGEQAIDKKRKSGDKRRSVVGGEEGGDRRKSVGDVFERERQKKSVVVDAEEDVRRSTALESGDQDRPRTLENASTDRRVSRDKAKSPVQVEEQRRSLVLDAAQDRWRSVTGVDQSQQLRRQSVVADQSAMRRQSIAQGTTDSWPSVTPTGLGMPDILTLELSKLGGPFSEIAQFGLGDVSAVPQSWHSQVGFEDAELGYSGAASALSPVVDAAGSATEVGEAKGMGRPARPRGPRPAPEVRSGGAAA